jgi:hypothetical protein
VADLTTVRAALAAAVNSISGLVVHATIPSSLNVPAAVIAPATGQFLTFDTTMSRGSDDLAFRVLVLVGVQDDAGAQGKLDAYLAGSGASSIKAAVEADPDLGGTVHYVTVEGASDYGLHDFGGTSYFGAAFTVTCGVS